MTSASWMALVLLTPWLGEPCLAAYRCSSLSGQRIVDNRCQAVCDSGARECPAFCKCLKKDDDVCAPINVSKETTLKVKEDVPPGSTLFDIPVLGQERWAYALKRTDQVDGSVWSGLQAFFKLSRIGAIFEMIVNQTPDLEHIYDHYNIKASALILILTCKRNGLPDEDTEIFMEIVPVNEFPPEFVAIPGRQMVPEDTKVGSTVFNLGHHTMDRDVNPSTLELSAFGISEYTANIRQDGRAYFQMPNMQSGLVVLKKSLNFEALQPLNATLFYLNVSASDRQGLTSYTTLTFEITDVDDLPPEFYHPGCPRVQTKSRPCLVSYEATAPLHFQGEVTQIEPGLIQARDLDTVNNDIHFSLEQGPGEHKENIDKFSINETTGALYLLSPFLTPMTIDMVIVATEEGENGKSTQASLTMTVQDASEPDMGAFSEHKESAKDNDKKPEGNKSQFTVEEILFYGVVSSLVAIILLLLLVTLILQWGKIRSCCSSKSTVAPEKREENLISEVSAASRDSSDSKLNAVPMTSYTNRASPASRGSSATSRNSSKKDLSRDQQPGTYNRSDSVPAGMGALRAKATATSPAQPTGALTPDPRDHPRGQQLEPGLSHPQAKLKTFKGKRAPSPALKPLGGPEEQFLPQPVNHRNQNKTDFLSQLPGEEQRIRSTIAADKEQNHEPTQGKGTNREHYNIQDCRYNNNRVSLIHSHSATARISYSVEDGEEEKEEDEEEEYEEEEEEEEDRSDAAMRKRLTRGPDDRHCATYQRPNAHSNSYGHVQSQPDEGTDPTSPSQLDISATSAEKLNSRNSKTPVLSVFPIERSAYSSDGETISRIHLSSAAGRSRTASPMSTSRTRTPARCTESEEVSADSDRLSELSDGYRVPNDKEPIPLFSSSSKHRSLDVASTVNNSDGKCSHSRQRPHTSSWAIHSGQLEEVRQFTGENLMSQRPHTSSSVGRKKKKNKGERIRRYSGDEYSTREIPYFQETVPILQTQHGLDDDAYNLDLLQRQKKQLPDVSQLPPTQGGHRQGGAQPDQVIEDKQSRDHQHRATVQRASPPPTLTRSESKHRRRVIIDATHRQPYMLHRQRREQEQYRNEFTRSSPKLNQQRES